MRIISSNIAKTRFYPTCTLPTARRKATPMEWMQLIIFMAPYNLPSWYLSGTNPLWRGLVNHRLATCRDRWDDQSLLRFGRLWKIACKIGRKELNFSVPTEKISVKREDVKLSCGTRHAVAYPKKEGNWFVTPSLKYWMTKVIRRHRMQ